MSVRQGDLYWGDQGEPEGSEAGYRRPYVVLQNDLYNTGRIRTTIVCALTTSPRRANDRTNVLLEPGEGNLPQQSIVVVSLLYTVDKDELTEYIGKLSPSRVRQILDGLNGLLEPIDADEEKS